MTYYYDTRGWLSDTPILGRETDVVPMVSKEDMKPNFTGYIWILQKYADPAPEIAVENETHNAPILAQLATADARIIRAIVEGDNTRLAAHEVSQAILRASLK